MSKERKTFDVRAEVFIIPNEAGRLDDILSSGVRDGVLEVSELSGKIFNNIVDRAIDVWLTNKPELGSENLRDHGFRVKDENGVEYYCNLSTGLLPSWIFKRKKEGETVQCIIPGYCTAMRSRREMLADNEREKAVFNFELSLNQSSYRYSRYGTFEEVFRYVMNKSGVYSLDELDKLEEHVNKVNESDKLPDKIGWKSEVDKLPEQIGGCSEVESLPDEIGEEPGVSNEDAERAYDKINKEIDALQREIDENGKNIDDYNARGLAEAAAELQKKHELFCDEMDKLLAKRRELAKGVF